MSKTFETRMREEFKWLQKLQSNPNVKDIVTIYYMPRTGASRWAPINTSIAQNSGYPVKFKVQYKMPMYVCPTGQMKKNWQGSIYFEVTEEAMLGNGSMGVGIEGGGFPAGSIPYNKHVSQGFICCGNAWEVAKQGYGIWYFVIAVGALLNLDPFWQAEHGDHLNGDAREFFENVRHRQPTNNIRWPYNLRDNSFTIQSAAPAKKTFSIKPLN